MLRQHLWTTFHLAQLLVPHMSANGWGRLIVITSPSAGAPPANGLPYAVGKAAEETLMLTLAEELKGTGVTANIIRVRMIDTSGRIMSKDPDPEQHRMRSPRRCSTCARMKRAWSTVRALPLYGSP